MLVYNLRVHSKIEGLLLLLYGYLSFIVGNLLLVNPRRACAARVTVVGFVCLCVCLLSHISPMERLFLMKTRATKVKKIVGICVKRLRSRVMPRNMSEKANMLIIPTYPLSVFSARHTAKRQKVPNDCQQHSALPKTMPTNGATPCWSENHALQPQREAWPISAHAHWHSTQVVWRRQATPDWYARYAVFAPRVLHFSAFHNYTVIQIINHEFSVYFA